MKYFIAVPKGARHHAVGRALFYAAVAFALSTSTVFAKAGVTFGTADIGGGIVLHYAEEGQGAPVVFVHGSLGDERYWKDQVDAFSTKYHAIAYSRRYNQPNTNPDRPGYSAVTDADDLAAFIQKQHLGKVFLIGHSYGALTALFLAVRHPEMIRAVVLAEPPAVTLLDSLPGNEAQAGKAMYADIQQRMLTPMKAAADRGDTAGNVAAFIDYVFNDPQAWAKFSPSDQADTLRDAHEFDVIMTSGTLFPYIDPKAIQDIKLPVLIMSGGKSYAFLGPIDRELERLIPGSHNIIYPNDGHQMWYQSPELCRQDAEDFFALHSDAGTETK